MIATASLIIVTGLGNFEPTGISWMLVVLFDFCMVVALKTEDL